MQPGLAEVNSFLREENAKLTDTFEEVPDDAWPRLWAAKNDEHPTRYLWNRSYLVQVFEKNDGRVRLTINRTELVTEGRWIDGITWDELQRIKSNCGYGDKDAVEIYPKDQDVVNDANRRHLWILPEHGLDFIWRRK